MVDEPVESKAAEFKAAVMRNRESLRKWLQSANFHIVATHTHTGEALSRLLLGSANRPEPIITSSKNKSLLGRFYGTIKGVADLEEAIKQPQLSVTPEIHAAWENKFKEFCAATNSLRPDADTVLKDIAEAQKNLYMLFIDMRMASWTVRRINASSAALEKSITKTDYYRKGRLNTPASHIYDRYGKGNAGP